MILKEKDAYTGNDERGFYGHKQEQDVAFHLRREFGDSQTVRIINDLVIEHEGERAQIDHLVIHPYGFIIIESKSIVGEVKVNAEGEWSRSYQGKWMGMPSPIRQAELQKQLLHRLMRANVEQLVSKILGVQTQVGGRDWQTICAVSSTAILQRDQMPKDISSRVIKTEFVAKKVKDVVGNFAIALIKVKPKFSAAELDNIGRFLLAHTEQVAASQKFDDSIPEKIPETPVAEAPAPYIESPRSDEASPEPQSQAEQFRTATAQPNRLTCKRCGEAEQLMGMYGKYGYYIKCRCCGANTSMKQDFCPGCGERDVRINKSGVQYMATCRSCNYQYLVYLQVV